MHYDALFTSIAPPFDDPWVIPVAQRRHLHQANQQARSRWMPRLTALVEPPLPNDDFPTYLLERPTFARLRRAVEHARSRRDLDTATADELQRFVDLFRGYLAGDPA